MGVLRRTPLLHGVPEFQGIRSCSEFNCMLAYNKLVSTERTAVETQPVVLKCRRDEFLYRSGGGGGGLQQRHGVVLLFRAYHLDFL